MKRVIACALALCLTVCLFSVPAAAVSRDGIVKWTMPLATSVDLIEMTHAEETADGPKNLLQQNVLTYEPNLTVRPMVIYGSTLYGRSTMSKIAAYLEDENLSLVAGVNGSFFDMSTGIPYGFVVTDGVLRTSGSVNSVGFSRNGGVIIGNPDVHIFVSGGPLNNAEVFYNKVLTTGNGIGLYSRDYDTATKNPISAYNVVLTPTSDSKSELTLPGEMTLKVTKIVENTASCPIPAKGFVLSIAEKSTYSSALSSLKAVQVGDTLTFSALCDDMWKGIAYACGGGDLLVEDGEALTSFTLDTKDEQRARTAIGRKSDGTLVIYTADESSNSAGIDLYDLADKMAELGCDTALNLDGGGSTMVGVQYPGYDKCATANSPTDGAMRACANFIFLVREKTEAEAADRLFLYPAHSFALPGAKIGFSLKATDLNYVPTDLPGKLSWSSNYGTLGSNSLTLDSASDSAIPAVTVDVKADGMRASASVTVLSQVTDIRITKEDGKTKVKALHVPGESDVQLAAAATYYGRSVISAANSFTWETTGGVGSITQDGKFTAASVSKLTEGTIKVSYGQTSVSVPVTVSPANPFSDTKGHWAENYINDLYFEGTITGSTGKDGKLLYRPDDSMTRQEFVVALMRYLGTNLANYDSVSLPFVDSKEIGTWALDAMKAAYSLGYMGGSNELGKLYAHPTATITRQEAMVILARTMKDGAEAATDLDRKFTDSANIASWARESLAQMVYAGIISGSNGKLNPTGKVTRAEVAKMLWALENQ